MGVLILMIVVSALLPPLLTIVLVALAALWVSVACLALGFAGAVLTALGLAGVPVVAARVCKTVVG